MAVFDDLVNAYCNPARHYHNLDHIAQILELLEQIKDIADRFVVLQFSAWFHDYIYNPQGKDNEVASAIYAERILQELNLDLEIIQPVKQIIISTKKHEPLLDSVDNLFFLDADLSILGTSPDKYWAYARAIRQEYQYLSDRDYSLGRKKVLNSFLKRARIYYSDRFYQQFEQQARKNLIAEIKAIN
ncbi:hypothetical protein I4641_13170 [Waterburya agarophytonicola K14]|uniref:HD domain-containing protein n=1 Tax=Waterburya agarophytonicola KI4 TaxID=2874699 RepID=A0A964BR38_9CYAN|nr:hypothetical protein [Waterburya agarophytonicola]MCC0177930.1 hypothetical protein [Waterburya agarophytonicola KI4]